MKKRTNKKEYDHIAVSTKLKTRFENIRFKMIGEEIRAVTQEELLEKMMDKYESKK